MPDAGHAEQRLRTYWQWRVLICLMGCYLFYYTGRLVIGHALPLMEEDLGFTSEELGKVVSALLLAYGLGQAINGNLGDWIGARRMLALGAIGSAFMCWVFSFQSTLIALIAAWAVNGYVQSFGWAPGGRLISLWWPAHRRGLAFGLYMFAAGGATVLVGATSWFVLSVGDADDPARWRWLFRIPVLALAVAGALFYLLVRDKPQDVGLEPGGEDDAREHRQSSSTGSEHWFDRYLHVLVNVRFLAASLVIFFQSFARYGLLTWIPSYYTKAGIRIENSILISIALAVGMSAGAFAGGYISDRVFFGRRTIGVAVFLGLSAVTCAALAWIPVDDWLGHVDHAVLLFLSGFFVYGAQGPLWALCPELVGPSRSGTAVGIMDAVAYLGAAAQGVVLGATIDRFGFSVAFAVIMAAVIVGAVTALAVRK